MSLGIDYLMAVAASGDVNAYLKNEAPKHLFNIVEVDVAEPFHQHVLKYGALPSPNLVADWAEEDEAYKPDECPAYYLDHMRERHIYTTLKHSGTEVNGLLKEKRVEEAMAAHAKVTMELFRQTNSMQLTDFRESFDMVIPQYKKTLKGLDGGGINLGWDTFDAMSGGLYGGDMVSYVGRPAMGKAQPLDAQVLTPNGFRNMGDLKVGDLLTSIDGQESRVTDIYPQGVLDTYRLTFSDGRSTEACANHLWEVMYRDWDAPRVLKTSELLTMLEKARYQKRLSVRLFDGNGGRPQDVPVDPWLLGALLGDGCFRAKDLRFSTADPELVDEVNRALPMGFVLKHRKAYDYSVVKDPALSWHVVDTHVIEALEVLDLWGLKSEHKHIPPVYFELPRPQRLALLQGLMDTDGWAEKTGATCFASASQALAEGVQRLVRSLGGLAKTRYKENAHAGAWVVNIQMQNPKELFRLERKRERVRETATHAGQPYELRATLVSIESSRATECQCITVSHPSRLYVTDDYVVTHNTWMMLWSAYKAWLAGEVPMLISMEMLPLLLMQRITAIHTQKSLTQIKNAELSTAGYKRVCQQLIAAKGEENPFWVVDGNLTATVEDIWKLMHQLKPTMLLIDGAYLLKHPDRRLNKFARIDANCELIKSDLCTGLQVPTVCSYQFNREATKLRKDETAGMEHIAGSDAIPQLSSIVLGLMEHESVETINRRRVEILKGRSGEVGQFDINWDFNTMNFGEFKELELEDLAYM